MTKFNIASVKATLTKFRNDLRLGLTKTKYGVYGDGAVKQALALAFGVLDFTETNFNAQTLQRFQTLFNTPKVDLIDVPGNRWPSQDETATAVQNFINRRLDPWAHVRPSQPVEALSQLLPTNA